MNNKVTVITDRFYPDENSTSYFLTEITQTISEANAGNINVICAGDLNGYEELSFLKNKIIRLSSGKLSKNNNFSRIFRVSFLGFKLGWYSLFNVKRGERVFTYTLEPLILILAIIRKFKSLKITLLVYDVFPENLISANLLKKNSLRYKVLKIFFDWAYRQTDHLIVIGRDMQKLIKKKTEGTIPISLVTNWCDIDKIKVELKNKNQIIKNLNLENKTVFSFVGNLGKVQGIDFLLKVSSLVKNPDFVLLFIGNGAFVSRINKYIEQSNKNNVIYAGHFPASDNNLVLNACDIAIVSLNKTMYGLGVPSKSYNNMAAMKPILYIGHKESEIGKVVKENNIGWVCDESDANEVARKIELIIDEKTQIKAFGKNARHLAQKSYSKKYILNKYRKIFS